MNSNKRNTKIQKTVEDSILNAVTRDNGAAPSPLDDDATRPLDQQGINFGNLEADALWKTINQHNANVLNKDQKKSTATPNVSFDSNNPFGGGPESQVPSKSLEKVSEFPFVGEIVGEQRANWKSSPKLPKEPQESANPNPPTNATVLPEAIGLPQKEVVFRSAPPIPTEAPNFPLANLNSVQLKLYEGEHLKIAQKKIEELEAEIERLRLENERLGGACELFKKQAEEQILLREQIQKKLESNEERFSEERSSLKAGIENRAAHVKTLELKIEDLEGRVTNDIRKSMSRERELENRLELARLEKISLVGSKDEIILDMKRQVDQLNHELGNYRRKAAEMNEMIEANQEQFRRTVRALRLALTNLEVNEQIGSRSKKAE